MTENLYAAPIGSGVLEVERRRGGIVRVTTGRVVECTCDGCDLRFDNTGAAASHARSSLHVVQVFYACRFRFQPGGAS